MPDVRNTENQESYMVDCNEWLVSGFSGIDLQTGLRRARAATLMILALPGSTYLYQ